MNTEIKVQDVKGQIDKRNIYLLLGCYCNEPRALLKDETSTKSEDYPELFHNIIFSALLNIVYKGNITKITPIEIENEISQFPNALEVWKINNGFEYIESAIEDTKTLIDNIGFYRDTVRKYSILRSATEDLKLDLSFIYDENNEKILSKFNTLTSDDVLKLINERFQNFKDLWKNISSENDSFKISDNIENLIELYKTRETSYGYPFQSGYLTRCFGGYREQKYYLFSSQTGGGKTRIAIGDACNISTIGYYDWSINKWISTGDIQPVLFISIELSREEIQLCALGHISGINPKKIEDNTLTPKENEILNKSIEVIKHSKLYCEYLPEFDADNITDIIEEYIVKHNVQYVFFDYINESQKMYQYCYKKTHNSLRTDQILFELSSKLKLLANKFNISISSATQLTREDENVNRNKIWNTKTEADIKGSKAVTEKIDYGTIILPVTDKELKALEPIINKYQIEVNGFKKPNYVYNVYKARGSDYNKIRIWVNFDLGCVRMQDCFVTDYFGNLIDMERINSDFGIIENFEL